MAGAIWVETSNSREDFRGCPRSSSPPKDEGEWEAMLGGGGCEHLELAGQSSLSEDSTPLVAND